MKKLKENKYIVLIAIVIIIVLVDQISKICITNMGGIEITQNTNAAYGIGDNSTVMYVITNLVILSIIFKFITSQNEYVDTKLKVFLSLIFAGGLSNVIDRIFRGYVVEFANLKQFNIPAFNIADICVLIGWIAMAAIFAVFTVNEMRANREKNKDKKDNFEDEDKENEKTNLKEKDHKEKDEKENKEKRNNIKEKNNKKNKEK